MKTILMATDLSSRSAMALPRAVRLAVERGAALIVQHVVDESLPEQMQDVLKTGAEEILRNQIAAVPGHETIDRGIVVASGRPSADILRHAAEAAADLIVLGARPKAGLKDAFRGTTAERVIRAAHVPVLVVKTEAKESYRRVLVGTDFSVHARHAMQTALRVAPEAECCVVHAYLVPFGAFMSSEATREQVEGEHQRRLSQMIGEEMDRFTASFAGAQPRLRQVMREGIAQECILREVVSSRADLLVVGSHGRTGVAHAFLGSVAEDLLTQAPCDVLVARAW